MTSGTIREKGVELVATIVKSTIFCKGFQLIFIRKLKPLYILLTKNCLFLRVTFTILQPKTTEHVARGMMRDRNTVPPESPPYASDPRLNISSRVTAIGDAPLIALCTVTSSMIRRSPSGLSTVPICIREMNEELKRINSERRNT